MPHKQASLCASNLQNPSVLGACHLWNHKTFKMKDTRFAILSHEDIKLLFCLMTLTE